MNDSRIAWRSFSTGLDKHPEDQEYLKDSEHLWSDYEWCGEWEPFGGVSSGKWYGREGGNQHAFVLWKRPCCPKVQL